MCKTLTTQTETRSLRRRLGQYPTGVAIVTTEGRDGKPVGMTINSFHSISMVPALVGWCIDRHAASYCAFAQAEQFSITVLNEHQADVATRFAQRGADKFHGLRIEPGKPLVIPNGSAWFQCSVFNRFRLGDHLMLIGQVIDSGESQASPLVFAQGAFQSLPSLKAQTLAVSA
ncbi:flavin reductase family protein [Aestuariicella hydrocarbonica]|uniref:Flavin reductase family protein n=1 Tax=Pseudomaricurvus hydrocarbonicus TaxID=1470433 RepID=A0A9E5JUP7_9GAMM|nr:flavin reductase family protein [Aestuariicella hydrocarbonica]NHO65938.1 flavin reductase family protein [Aestuariicella hydrocarbonica]